MQCKVIVQEGEDGWFVVTCPSLPGCISQGKTIEEALSHIKEAIELYLEPDEDDLILTNSARMIEIAV